MNAKKELIRLGTFQDPDGTIKSVYKDNNSIIETTLLINKSSRNSDVYCLPTHDYCSLSCKMCHLTKENFNKPMNPINSDSLIESIIKTAYNPKSQRRTQNKNAWLAFMGVGEPLLNLTLLKEVFEKEYELKQGANYEQITYALSTMMPNNNLEKLATYANNNNFPLKVHFSMHSPFKNERLQLLPKAKLSIEQALNLLTNYRSVIQNNSLIQENFKKFHSDLDPIEIHYTLIQDQNDSDKHLDETISLLDKFQIPFKLLTFNETANLKRSKKEQHWIDELKKSLPNLKIKIYNPPGHNVGSSCGEFTKHYYLSKLETKKEKQEFENWKKKYKIE